LDYVNSSPAFSQNAQWLLKPEDVGCTSLPFFLGCCCSDWHGATMLLGQAPFGLPKVLFAVVKNIYLRLVGHFEWMSCVLNNIF